jgi:hypothetical protein
MGKRLFLTHFRILEFSKTCFPAAEKHGCALLHPSTENTATFLHISSVHGELAESLGGSLTQDDFPDGYGVVGTHEPQGGDFYEKSVAYRFCGFLDVHLLRQHGFGEGISMECELRMASQ